jgi:Xaa-Pro aminopeptidase
VDNRTFPYSAADLDRFRRVQRVAYDIALWVESQLQTGITEAEVRTLIAAGQADKEVVQVFHEPLAWFGSHTTLVLDPVPDVRTLALAASGAGPVSLPARSEHRLVDGVPVVIDLAPAVGGIASDVSYSCVFGHNCVFDELDRALARIRTFLLEGVRAGETLRSLYRELDAHLADHGWENCHRRHADRALGHLVFALEHEPARATPLPGLGTAAAEGILAAGAAARAAGTCHPIWNDSSLSDHPAAPGLWAVGPHIGFTGVGVKFEEVLVVTEDDAYWLDDGLPHSRRWAAAGYCAESFRPA